MFAPPAVCVFPPTLTLLPHPHCLTPPIPAPTPYSGLCSTLSRSFALLISSSPTVVHPSLLSSCVLDKCLRCLHFHHCRTNRIRGGCNSPFISLPSLVCYRIGWIPSVPFFCFVLFCLFRRSFLRSIAPSILVKSITSLLPVALCVRLFFLLPVFRRHKVPLRISGGGPNRRLSSCFHVCFSERPKNN